MERDGCEPVHHLYPIRLKRRDALLEHLTRQGIGSGIHYRTPAHRQPALTDHLNRYGSMKVTEEACGELLSLPIYPELSEEQLELVAKRVREFFAGEVAGRGAAS